MSTCVAASRPSHELKLVAPLRGDGAATGEGSGGGVGGNLGGRGRARVGVTLSPDEGEIRNESTAREDTTFSPAGIVEAFYPSVVTLTRNLLTGSTHNL